jgi:ABC-type phosphate transport system permease subunit
VFRHRFDPSSAVAAAVFLAVAARYLAHGFGRAPISFLWAVPATVIGLVVIGALRIAFRSRREP